MNLFRAKLLIERMEHKGTFLLLVVLLIFVFSQCNKEDKDDLPPKIELISPLNCDSVWRGDFLQIEVKFTGNSELSRYAIDIYENFDHQSGASSGQDCPQEPDKIPFNPFKYVSVQDIPSGLTEFTLKNEIIIPESVDVGDYLFTIYVQGKNGLQAYYAVNIKIVTDER